MEKNRVSITNLRRRVKALEGTLKRGKVSKRNLLLDLSIAAMVGAWTPQEIEEMLATPVPLEDQQLSPERWRPWAKHLDQISMKRFGMTFGALSAVSQSAIQKLGDFPHAG